MARSRSAGRSRGSALPGSLLKRYRASRHSAHDRRALGADDRYELVCPELVFALRALHLDVCHLVTPCMTVSLEARTSLGSESIVVRCAQCLLELVADVHHMGECLSESLLIQVGQGERLAVHDQPVLTDQAADIKPSS